MLLATQRHYWSGDLLVANAFIGVNLVGALLLGALVAYERSYQGRAAGMRSYGLVDVSAALDRSQTARPRLQRRGSNRRRP